MPWKAYRHELVTRRPFATRALAVRSQGLDPQDHDSSPPSIHSSVVNTFERFQAFSPKIILKTSPAPPHGESNKAFEHALPFLQALTRNRRAATASPSFSRSTLSALASSTSISATSVCGGASRFQRGASIHLVEPSSGGCTRIKTDESNRRAQKAQRCPVLLETSGWFT